MSEGVEKQVVGQCSAVIEKNNDWVEFEIQVPGKEYPIRVSTKLEHLVKAGREAKGQIATWHYKEVESIDRETGETKINPKSGKPFLNRYLESVELGAQTQQNANASEGPQSHHEAIHYADKDRAITRMACLKAAAVVYSSAAWAEDDDPPLAVMAAAARFETWIYRDIDEVPFSEATGESEPQSGLDDSIPF